MQKDWKVKFKQIFSIILVLFLVLINSTSKSMATPNKVNRKKAVVLILDEISLEEILSSNTPNMDVLLENGAIGLMNTRAKSSLLNRGSTYLSLGMGVRTTASTQGGLALGRDESVLLSKSDFGNENISTKYLYKQYTGKNPPDGEIINLAIEDIKRKVKEVSPNNQVGLLGKVAKENNLVIGVIGNSDTDKLSRESTMLAMDENGIIPMGSVGSDLLVNDFNILGGSRLNGEKLLQEVDRILHLSDILFIDYGDTTRIEKANTLAKDFIKKDQKKEAIERGDGFLGEVIKRVGFSETLFMIITPNPSSEMLNDGNFALTPIIISEKGMDKGLLTSSTTNREGLVTNFDFGPTLFNHFNIIESTQFIGENMKIVGHNNPEEALIKDQAQFLYLRKYRKVFHWAFIILVFITLIGLYLPRFIKWNGLPGKMISYLCSMVMSVPLTMLTVSIFGYKSIVIDLLYVFGGAFILSYILDKLLNYKLKIMAFLSWATSILVLLDVFFLDKLMIISPLGSDAIAGGRFYGVGNDYMGILLGSTLLGVFSIIHVYKTSRWKSLSISSYMLLVIIGLSPFYGANMGGTLSAVLIFIMIILIIFDKKISLKNTAIVFTGVFIGIIILAGLDAGFNPNPTHAGKAWNSLVVGGWSKFYEIISIKLGQVFWNIANASWNIILFLQIALMVLLHRYKREDLRKIRTNNLNLFKGMTITLLGGIIVFIFNDTGTIAAALMFGYLFIPLGILMNEKKK